MTMTSDFFSDWIAAAEQYVPADVRVDMCRHTTVTEPTFWLLRGESQIAAIAADNGKWRATRIHRGMPCGVRHVDGFGEAFAYVLE